MGEVTVMEQGNTKQLRIILWETIQGVVSGKNSPSQANAISNASGKWLGSIKLEIEAAKLMGKSPKIAALMSGEENTQG